MNNDANEYDPIEAFKCLDCGIDTNEIQEYYMVHNKLWNQAHPTNTGMLCIGCLEKRIGRKLTKTDFTDAPINNLHQPVFLMSKRFQNRLQN